MNAPLRPLTTGELLDRTFNLYRNHFILFAGIAAIAALMFVAALALLLVLGFRMPATAERVDPRAILAILTVYFLVITIFYLVGASLAMGATIFAVSKVHLGQQGTIRESYRRVLPRIGRIILIVLSIAVRMIGMLLLCYLALIPIGILVSLIGAALAGLGVIGAILMGVFGVGIVGVIYGMVLRVYLKYSLAIQACLLENLHVNESLRRSEFLTESSLWRIFLIHLLMGVIYLVLNSAMQWPVGMIFRQASVVTDIAQLLTTFIAFSSSFPISTIAVALLYYDQRVRKEAYDLQLMMESLNNPEPAAAAPIG
jgi:hypothetical protein